MAFDPTTLNLWAPFDAAIDDNPANGVANANALVADSGGLHPWNALKAQNVSGPLTNNSPGGRGSIYTITADEFRTATGHQPVPGINNSRVGVIKATPAGFQTDFYLQNGGGQGLDRTTIPADGWYQFWAFLPADSDFSSYGSAPYLRPCKFLYPTNAGWPSTNKLWRLDLYSKHPVTGNLLFTIRDQETGVLDWPGDPLRAPWRYHGRQNLDDTQGINRGEWSLIKIHIQTTGEVEGNRFEVWRRSYDSATWTKCAEYVSSATPALQKPPGFTWTIPAGENNGHGGARLFTTWPANTGNPTADIILYMKDFAIADSEAKLPQYRDGRTPLTVSDIGGGRWGLSRITTEGGGYTTFAAQQKLGSERVDMYYPPLSGGVYATNCALVRVVGTITPPGDGNTVLFPRDLANVGDVPLSDLTVAQRNALANTLTTWLIGYQYTDNDGVVTVPAFSTAAYTGTTTLKEVAADIFRYFQNSKRRPKKTLFETHNTEYLDDFSTDPTSRWTVELGGTPTWDSTDDELDFNANGFGEHLYRYSANGPGSIEHESQVTDVRGTSGTNRVIHCAVRCDSGGANDAYTLYENADGGLQIARYNAGTRTIISSPTGPGYTTGDFVHWRLAAEGTAGNNVDLSGWYSDTNSGVKPSDPGWIGADGSPTFTYTDTSVDRLDASTHEHCGIGGRGSSAPDYDTRHCHWKSRAITDRGAGGAYTLTADAFSYSYAGTAANLEFNRILTADAATYTYSATDANLEYGRTLSAEGATYTYAGTDANLEFNRSVTAESATYTYSATAANLEYNRVLPAETQTYSYSGTDANLEFNRVITAEAGSWTYTGQDATLTYNQSGAYTLTADGFSYTYTGQTANLEWNRVLGAEGSSWTYTGQDASLLKGYALSAESGTYSLTGTSANLEFNRVLTASAGSWAYTGTAATLTYASADAIYAVGLEYTLNPNNSDYSLYEDKLHYSLKGE